MLPKTEQFYFAETPDWADSTEKLERMLSALQQASQGKPVIKKESKNPGLLNRLFGWIRNI